MDDSQNQVMEAVGDGCQWEQRPRRETHENLSEELVDIGLVRIKINEKTTYLVGQAINSNIGWPSCRLKDEIYIQRNKRIKMVLRYPEISMLFMLY